MLDRTITGEQAWRDTLDVSTCSVSLPDRCVDLLDRAVADFRSASAPMESFSISEYDHPALREVMAPVAEALDSGHGFAVVDRLPVERYTPDEARLMFWLLGQLIGPPFEQSAGGSVMFDVRDAGKDVNQGARYAETNRELTFHTDNARSAVVPEIVALLCMHPAKAGGISQLISVYSVHNELLEHHRNVLETLYRPFLFDRRGLGGGEEVSEFPVFGWDGGELLCRFIRLYIEVGHQKANRPLTPDQVQALDIMQEILQRRELRAEFRVERGQLLFTNNHWVLHNRTEFVDYPELERKRHFVRLWLSQARGSGKR
ncbi:MAG: TauD/TfdA family dioxygenase [bacterium]|nr:TauD/TfdA family dioxygenase [bacterium]